MHASFITDLALILMVASVAILLFKWLKQPVVLGYIVAGFLVGPHMQLVPTVIQKDTVSTWAEIGVIFLMFSLGLEFSFKKIFQMGSGPMMAAVSIILSMMALGSGVGMLFGWNTMNSLFLGGIMAISSTTIIYKALEELGLRNRKFAGEVLSVLVLEDILGILLMVTLSAIAVSRNIEGEELAMSMLKLAFFLVLWFIVGVYLIPQLLRRTKHWLNRETLLIVSVGLCFFLVVMAESIGYSAALGAFMMGSIIAETLEAENVERVISPLKDLFGAIFFVSVGMMVDPAILLEYWKPIVIICLSIIGGQMIFGTGAFLLSGSPLKAAMASGFSLAQIGEFSFIIAQLGVSLKVTSDFLYPVAVAVSIITTFLTPYMIRAAHPAYNLLSRVLPDRIVSRLDDRSQSQVKRQRSLWQIFFTAMFSQVVVFLTLTIAVIGLSFALLLPLSRSLLGHWAGNIVCGLITLFVVAPFLRAIVMRKNHNAVSRELARRNKLNRVIIWAVFIGRYCLAAFSIYYVLDYLSPYRYWIHILVAIALVGLIILSRFFKYKSIRLERTFMQNLGTRERAEKEKNPMYAHTLQSRDMHLSQVVVPAESKWGGMQLKDLGFGKDTGVLLAAIVRGGLRLNIPGGDTMIFPGDVLEVISDDAGMTAFGQRLEVEIYESNDDRSSRLRLRAITIAAYSPFCGIALKDSTIRDEYQCMVVGFETLDGSMDIASADRIIKAADKIWVVGEESSLKTLFAANVAVRKAVKDEMQTD